MYGAWEAMPAASQRRLVGLRIKHDATYNSGGYVREGVTPTDDPRTAPGVLHPLLQAHPDTGRLGLYLGRRRNAYLEGLPVDESDALLDEIWASVTEPVHTWTHHWQVGDVVLWDNRCTMHRRDAFDPASRRVMHRTQIRQAARTTASRNPEQIPGVRSAPHHPG